ncbi:MAG: hypothetical protein JRC99_10955 [Deltaproteobacteria bacterium]|nr:hypothetical protein [Deltaproteobacteria bacterium]
MAGTSVCQITGTLCGIDGAAKAGAQVRATVKSTQADLGGQLADGAGITSETISAITQDDGTFSLQTIQGATIVLDIPDINLKKEILVPALSTVDFSTLI